MPSVTNSAKSTNATFAVNLSSDATMLIAFHTEGRIAADQTAVTWNSDEALTELITATASSNDAGALLWYLHDPTPGNHNIVYSCNTGTYGNFFVAGITGIDSDDPWRTQYATDGTYSPVTQIGLDLSPEANDLQLGALATWRAGTPVAGTTDAVTDTDTVVVQNNANGGMFSRAGLGNMSMNTGNASTPNETAFVGVSIKPTPTPVSEATQNAILFSIGI
jgi:hypothetical protein